MNSSETENLIWPRCWIYTSYTQKGRMSSAVKRDALWIAQLTSWSSESGIFYRIHRGPSITQLPNDWNANSPSLQRDELSGISYVAPAKKLGFWSKKINNNELKVNTCSARPHVAAWVRRLHMCPHTVYRGWRGVALLFFIAVKRSSWKKSEP